MRLVEQSGKLYLDGWIEEICNITIKFNYGENIHQAFYQGKQINYDHIRRYLLGQILFDPNHNATHFLGMSENWWKNLLGKAKYHQVFSTIPETCYNLYRDHVFFDDYQENSYDFPHSKSPYGSGDVRDIQLVLGEDINKEYYCDRIIPGGDKEIIKSIEDTENIIKNFRIVPFEVPWKAGHLTYTVRTLQVPDDSNSSGFHYEGFFKTLREQDAYLQDNEYLYDIAKSMDLTFIDGDQVSQIPGLFYPDDFFFTKELISSKP